MREGSVKRKTGETDISVNLRLNGEGRGQIDTGIGFFDHMLEAFKKHSGLDMQIKVVGDTHVDCHHTIEDTGIVLGQALNMALGDKAGIKRFGSAMLPMDEALAECAADIGGRAFLVFNCSFSSDRIGDMDTQMVEEFFRAFAQGAGLTLHLNLRYGKNDHHKAEALFKAAALALREAVSETGRTDIPSTKGVI